MTSRSGGRSLGGFALLALVCCSSNALAQGSFASRASGPWNDAATWRLLDGTDDDAIPDADDSVQIKAGHRVELTAELPAHANSLNIYGELGMGGEQPVTLRVRSIYVRGTGVLDVEGPHTIMFEGAAPGEPASFLETRGAAHTTLRGQILIAEGDLDGVIAETADTVEIALDGLEPDALVGARWKFLSGRARLRTFEVVANTADRVQLRATELGGPRLDTFEADPTPGGMLLSTPTPTLRILDREHADRAWAGRWVRSEAGTLHVVLGATDGADAADTVTLWPPITGHATLRHTWGLEPGDRFTVDRPVQLTVPPDARPDALFPAHTYSLGFLGGSFTDLDRVSIAHGNLRVVNIDETLAVGHASLQWVDLRQSFGTCQLEARGTTGLVLDHLVVADVHPDTEDVEHGGTRAVGSPSSQGLCLYGQDFTVRDVMISNTGDAAIFAGSVQGLVLTGSIATAVGTFHGNNLEAIAFKAPSGDIVLDGNALFGGAVTLWMQGRTAGSSLAVTHSVLAQPGSDALIRDLAPTDAALLLEDNLLLAVHGTVESKAGSGASLTRSTVIGASILGVDGVDSNAIWNDDDARALVRHPQRLSRNLLRGAGPSTVELSATPLAAVAVEANVLTGPSPAAFAHPATATPVHYTANAAYGAFFVGLTAPLPDGADVTARDNRAMAHWTTTTPSALLDLMTREPSNTLEPCTECGTWWTATDLPQAGVLDPEPLPPGFGQLLLAAALRPWSCADTLAPGPPAQETPPPLDTPPCDDSSDADADAGSDAGPDAGADAGADADDPPIKDADDGGCGCQHAPTRSPPRPLLPLTLVAAATLGLGLWRTRP